jgi:methyltransferase
MTANRRRVPRWYLMLLALAGAQRLQELAVSRRRERQVDGRRAAGRSYPLMVSAHLALFTLPLLEAACLRRRSRAPVCWIALLGAATALRLWSIRSLGRSWNVRGVVPVDLRPVEAGPYRWIRHPNYLAVVVEFLALPMAGGAWLSALGLSALNALVLLDRIRDEERLLRQVPGYEEAFGSKARFIPGVF